MICSFINKEKDQKEEGPIELMGKRGKKEKENVPNDREEKEEEKEVSIFCTLIFPSPTSHPPPTLD